MTDPQKVVEDRKEALAEVITAQNKRWGAGTLGFLPDIIREKIDAVSSGVLALDRITGIGGIPRGRVTEILGDESSGKTTLCQTITAEAQKIGESAWIELEHTLNKGYAARCGIDVDRLVVAHAKTAEQALEVLEALLKSGLFVTIVVDSVSTMVPSKEIEGDAGDAQMAMLARLLSQAERKLTGIVSNSNTALIFINQLRVKIGETLYPGGPPVEVGSGGRALPYWASLRLKLHPRKGGIDYMVVNAITEKNKVGGAEKSNALFEIVYNQGVDKLSDLIAVWPFEQAGAWYRIDDERKWNGKEKLKEELRNNPELANEIREAVLGA